MSKSSKNILVFISSGIGNSVLMIPLLNELNKFPKISITILLDSPFLDKDYLRIIGFPVDSIIQFSSLNRLKYILSNINRFDVAYLDFSSSSVRNLLIATIISQKVKYMRKKKLPLPKTIFVKPEEATHAAILNMRLLKEKYSDKDFALDDIRLKNNIAKPEIITRIKKLTNIIISVQVSAANLAVKYKNWPIEYWIEFFDLTYSKYNKIFFLLLGDSNEIEIGKRILEGSKNKNIISFIGKTELSQAVSILKHSDLYVGLDSGFMHLAVAFGIPTFTIFGASSENMYGYQKFESQKHRIIVEELSCRSCNIWIGNNTTKVDNPNNCPDFECLNKLKPEIVFNEFIKFLSII